MEQEKKWIQIKDTIYRQNMQCLPGISAWGTFVQVIFTKKWAKDLSSFNYFALECPYLPYLLENNGKNTWNLVFSNTMYLTL